LLSAIQCDHISNVQFTKDHKVKITTYSVNVITVVYPNMITLSGFYCTALKIIEQQFIFRVLFFLFGSARTVQSWKALILNTVKLGYNELGYNEHSVITNKIISLVCLGHFHDKLSQL